MSGRVGVAVGVKALPGTSGSGVLMALPAEAKAGSTGRDRTTKSSSNVCLFVILDVFLVLGGISHLFSG